MPSLDAEIKALIKAHSPYFEPLDNGKVKCTLNGHEFAPRKDVIEAFVKYVLPYACNGINPNPPSP